MSVERVLLTPEAARLVPAEEWLALAPDVPVEVAEPGERRAKVQPEWTEGGVWRLCVGVGVVVDDVALRESVAVYLHVGRQTDLFDCRGVAVPLNDQGAAGVRNALRWAQTTQAAPQPWATHADVAAHAGHAAAQYRDPAHVRKAERVCSEATDELLNAFPELVAVLGTGFPFYCMTDTTHPDRDPVPPSIRVYTQEQERLFAGKLLPLTVLVDRPGRIWTKEELAGHGVNIGQESANAYEYLRHGAAPPTAPEAGALVEFERANVCVRGDRPWPCHVCTTLHDRRRYPEQSWERDFMKSCVRCRQTPYLPRAVGVLSSDIDLVALTAPGVDRHGLAERVSEWIDGHPRFFRHDTRWTQQLNGAHGPLDVFVTGMQDFLRAAAWMADRDRWMEVTVPSTVTWLPVTDIDYEVGKYLPLCMELLADRTPGGGFSAELRTAKARFAARVTAEQVLSSYRRDSSYLRQLAGNPQVAALLAVRNAGWRTATDESSEDSR
ncbi:hypothetical protein ACLQ28_31520 [Micromonospora sp. DT201]|uniref:hypothetical protein n=1 Tax=Micromonospora sp. DT201 TaxID=3393442 RepID=UPI003CE728D2